MRKKLIAVLLCAALLFCMCGIAAAAAEKTRYVVLGDSIAYGSGLSNARSAVYGRIVADTNGYDYANYAVPGATTADLLRRMDIEEVRAAIADADILNISIGGNNFLRDNLYGLLYAGLVKNDYSRFEAIGAELEPELEKIVAKIRQLNPDAAILLQTLYNPQTGYVGEVYQHATDKVNEAVRAFDAAHPGEIIIADVGAALTDSGRDFAADRIHPSAVGNEKIARVILLTLRDNGLGENTEPVVNTPGRDAFGTGGLTVFVDIFGKFLHILGTIRNLLVRSA